MQEKWQIFTHTDIVVLAACWHLDCTPYTRGDSDVILFIVVNAAMMEAYYVGSVAS